MSHDFELLDATIIQRHAEHEVLSCRQEVLWPDGSVLGVHPVRLYGGLSTLLRAVHHQGHWVVFRLDALMPQLAHDLPAAPRRDHPGTVLYSLRGAYHSAARCLQDIEAVADARWPGSPRAAQPRPARDGTPRALPDGAALAHRVAGLQRVGA